MYPITFKYKLLTISSYGLMLMLAFLICNYLLRKYLININQDPKIADDIIFYAALGGILGSKIYYILEQALFYSDYSNIDGIANIFKGLYQFDLSLIFLGINQFGSGLVFLGGLIGGFISVTYYIKKNNLNTLEVYDWVAPFLALGHAIGRIGCFLVGDCYGKVSTLPWAMAFPNGSPPTLEYVHPTQLYEVATGILIYLYLAYIRDNKKQFIGQIFFEYLFLAGLSRFLVEFLRVNPHYFINTLNLSGAQFISLGMILISSILMYYSRYRNKIK